MSNLEKEDKRKNFVTFLPTFQNFHLSKDPGKLTYFMEKEQGYNSHLIRYRNDKLDSLDEEAPGLNVLNIERGFLSKFLYLMGTKLPVSRQGLVSRSLRFFSRIIDTTRVFWKYSNQIDVLNVYNPYLSTFYAGCIYRMLNSKGTLYMKMDRGDKTVREIEDDNPALLKAKKLLLRFASFDLISVETSGAKSYMETEDPIFSDLEVPVIHIPNGIEQEKLDKFRTDSREKTILHSARMGDPQKNSKVVLRSFKSLVEVNDEWNLKLTGSMTPEFKNFFEEYIEEHNLQENIEYLGFVSKEKLYEEMSKSQIFFLPSRVEGFALAPIEAGFLGNVLLASDLGCIRELTNSGEYGFICKAEDINCFSEKLKQTVDNEERRKEMSERTSEYIRKNFVWGEISGKLSKNLEKVAR